MIKIYSTSSCAVCKVAKRDMLSKGIGYQEINVEEDIEGFNTMFEATGMSAVPQFNIDGEWVVGYDEKVIDRAMEDDFEFEGVGGQVYSTCESCEG